MGATRVLLHMPAIPPEKKLLSILSSFDWLSWAIAKDYNGGEKEKNDNEK